MANQFERGHYFTVNEDCKRKNNNWGDLPKKKKKKKGQHLLGCRNYAVLGLKMTQNEQPRRC